LKGLDITITTETSFFNIILRKRCISC